MKKFFFIFLILVFCIPAFAGSQFTNAKFSNGWLNQTVPYYYPIDKANLLLLFTGSDDSTSIIDSGQYTLTVNPTTVTIQSNVGDFVDVNSSLDINPGTRSEDLLPVSPAGTYAFIDFFIKWDAGNSNSYVTVYEAYQDATHYFRIRLYSTIDGSATDGLYFRWNVGNGEVSTGGTLGLALFSIGTWYHIYFVKGLNGSDTSWGYAVDGDFKSNNVKANETPLGWTNSTHWKIGYNSDDSGYGFNGQIDNFRMIKSTSLGDIPWTANFTAPTK